MSLRIVDDAPLAGLNTFGVASRARRLVILDDEQDLPAALAATRELPATRVLGGGSNVLFVDDFEGAILLMRTRGRRLSAARAGGAAGTHRIEVAAGEPWDGIVRWSLELNQPGLENLSMIPGSAGAAAIQNIGAYGLELAQRFDSLRAVHLRSGEQAEFTAPDCRFGYRDSLFKQPEGRDWLILELRLRVGTAFKPILDYKELRERFAAQAAVPDARTIAQAVRDIRAAKLPDPAVIGNAGSFFKNPVVGHEQALALQAEYPDMPSYAADSPQRLKLSAGWLIDRCGWKGYRDGDAGVHHAHALVLVNHGRASGRELLGLADRIRASVHERFGVELSPEPVIIERL